jgi:hypothetical protein
MKFAWYLVNGSRCTVANMLEFERLPPVPAQYFRLAALSPDELAEARRSEYISDAPESGAQIRRSGIDSSTTGVREHEVRDWRVRMYAIWFCYVYENFTTIEQPLYAIEELFLEFQTNILNSDGEIWGLAQRYAGAGAWDPTAEELETYHNDLRSYYDNARRLLSNWQQ